MNYNKIYDSLIGGRVNNPPSSGYTEIHHIIQKCMGGSDDPTNLVKLTAKEHFLAHHLLAKIHGGKLWCAYWFMCHKDTTSGAGTKVTMSQYAEARKNRSVFISESMAGENHPLFGVSMSDQTKKKIGDGNRGKKRTDEVKRKISASLMGNTRTTGHKFSEERLAKMRMFKHSEETKKKMSESKRGEKSHYFGKTFSEEHKRRIGESRRGKLHDDESKRKMKEAAKKKPKITCPHCGKTMDVGNHNQWHGDKCKMKVG